MLQKVKSKLVNQRVEVERTDGAERRKDGRIEGRRLQGWS